MLTIEELAFARRSLIEELDAISEYEERIQKIEDVKLKKVLVL